MRNTVKHMIYAILGTLLFALGMNLFIVPIGLYSGGFLGIGQMIRTVFVNYLHINLKGIDIAGIIYYAINLPLFILAYRKLGHQFFWSTVICVTFQTIFLTFIKSPSTSILEDPLTAALTGGIICGVGCGITLMNGGSGGGQDILGMYLSSNYHSFSVGKISILINVVVFAFCIAMYDITVVIYSLIYVAVYSYATDKMHAQNICTEVLIFTKHSEKSIHVIQSMNHTATTWNGIGAYKNQEVVILYTVISKYEAELLKSHLREEDPEAFAVFGNSVTVLGNYEKHLVSHK